MIKRVSPYVAECLRKNNAYYYGGEPLEVADLARQWGYIWGGRVILESLKTYGHDGGSSSGVSTTTSFGGGSSTSEPESSPGPQEPTRNEGQWDVD